MIKFKASDSNAIDTTLEMIKNSKDLFTSNYAKGQLSQNSLIDNIKLPPNRHNNSGYRTIKLQVNILISKINSCNDKAKKGKT